MKYLIHGACGRMGRVMQRVIREKDPDADLIPVDPMAKDEDVYHALADYSGPADCIIDFSHHTAAPALTAYAASRKLPLVIATTGQTPEELDCIRAASSSIALCRCALVSPLRRRRSITSGISSTVWTR